MNDYLSTNFSDKEFEGLMFNPLKVPEGRNIITEYKRLGKISEFRQPFASLDKNKIIRYIIFMYDKNSPFRVKFPDILHRKVEAARGAGWSIEKNGLFSDNVERVLRGENDSVNKMTVAYIRIHRNFKYSYLIGLEESFYRLMLEIMGGDMKNVEKMRKLQEDLEQITLELTSDDFNPLLKGELMRYIEQERLNLRPEDIARIANKQQQENEI